MAETGLIVITCLNLVTLCIVLYIARHLVTRSSDRAILEGFAKDATYRFRFAKDPDFTIVYTLPSSFVGMEHAEIQVLTHEVFSAYGLKSFISGKCLELKLFDKPKP